MVDALFVGIIVTGLGGAVAAGLILAAKAVDPPPKFRVAVQVDPDKIVSDKGTTVGGSYVIPGPVTKVGPPPIRANSCVGRYRWAHRQGGVDADSTTVLIRVFNLGANVAIDGVVPHVVSRSRPKQGAYITCPGRGGTNTRLPVVEIDLDSRPATLHEFGPNGQHAPLYVTVPRGSSAAFLLVGSALSVDSQWTANVRLDVNGAAAVAPITYGGAPFQTSSSLAVFQHSYEWIHGRWELSSFQQSADPRPVKDACGVFTRKKANFILRHETGPPQDEPSQPSQGISGERIQISFCSYAITGQNQQTGTIPSATLQLSGAASSSGGNKEYHALVRAYEQHGELKASRVHGPVAKGRALYVRRVGRYVINLQASPLRTRYDHRLYRVGKALKPRRSSTAPVGRPLASHPSREVSCAQAHNRHYRLT